MEMIPSIWTGMYAELPLHDAMRILHEYGWQAVEISTEHMVSIEMHSDPESIIDKSRNCLQALELGAPQAHALLHADVAAESEQDREKDIDRLSKHIEIAARLGVKNVVMHPGGGTAGPNHDGDTIRKLNIHAFRRLGDLAGERNMRIAIENMPYPGYVTSSELLELLQMIDHPAIGVTLDTSHANMCALDIPAMIHDFDSHLIALHISDNHGSSDEHLTPGGGNINWPPVMQALRQIDYEGNLNLEIPGERHKVLELRRLKTRFALTVAQWLVDLQIPEQS